LFVSGEDLGARVDCGEQGVKDTVSKDRLRGIRIFDISDIANPKNVGNVQTCRGSHTHSLLVDPKDPNNVYVYISGSAPVRSPNELAGCVNLAPDKDPNSALFRIEVIKVPLAHPEQAAIVSSPRIFTDLAAPPVHGETALDKAENAKEIAAAKARGAFTAVIFGEEQVAPDMWRMASWQLSSRSAAGPVRRRLQTAPSCASVCLTSFARWWAARIQTARHRRVRDRVSATTSRCIRRSRERAARAVVTGCCSTSAIRHIRFA
jgi:hypothetical protein